MMVSLINQLHGDEMKGEINLDKSVLVGKELRIWLGQFLMKFKAAGEQLLTVKCGAPKFSNKGKYRNMEFFRHKKQSIERMSFQSVFG
mmetsp:Transcript_11282/g.22653  ORF Transcript_11282/g.22653 Transcript_11282/m.22653 type:complete len:88 (+) Transcript_11282:204-467(+)|eukprot:CAMPEP_0181292242 /NCGR_PEP_ID=MMETSP1101-20121128/2398_1 /TAXON_ID=46948 /ORGANISM="Rhodomonas abbreviata, Strain Caron Lab Isolate" /LENGTH=87 /DNA_ID=CAMNT_0023396691 /DNA_START=204 /DNA_END=467 /DNA_ORIENTATION=-